MPSILSWPGHWCGMVCIVCMCVVVWYEHAIALCIMCMWRVCVICSACVVNVMWDVFAVWGNRVCWVEVKGVCSVRCVGSVRLRIALGTWHMWSPSAKAPYRDQICLNLLANPYMKCAKLHVSITYWVSTQWYVLTHSLSIFSPSYKVLGQLPDTDVYIDIDAYEEVRPFLSF